MTDRLDAPSLHGEPGWRPLQPPAELAGGPGFVSGESGGHRLRVRYFTDGGGRVLARVWFGPGCQGPPGHAHGGSIAAVLDEAMGAAAWQAGHPALAARIAVSFLRPVPLGTVATAEARVVRTEARKVHLAARLLAGGEVLARAEGLFVELPRERILGMAGG